MKLQELRFIVTLATEKHFGKASAKCFVSQPTLSVAIRKLEEELGVILFERDKSHVRLTPIGIKIVSQAKRVLEEADLLKQVAVHDADPLSGRFRLGAIYTVAPYLLPSLIKQINKLAPNMPLDVREDYTANLLKRLHDNEVDAVLISLPFEEQGVETQVLYKEEFVVVMPVNHPLSKNKDVSESSLMDYDVILLGEGHCLREQIIASLPKCFAEAKSEERQRMYSIDGSSLETIRHMVASGMGISILPKTATYTSSYGKKLLTTRPLHGINRGRTVVLAWRKSYPRQQAIQALIKAIALCDLDGAKK